MTNYYVPIPGIGNLRGNKSYIIELGDIEMISNLSILTYLSTLRNTSI